MEYIYQNEENKMATKKTNYFTELTTVDETKHIKKKGQFKYLSWPYAVRELKNRHPEATWETHEYDHVINGVTTKEPFMATRCGFFVKVTVTVEGIPATQIHPVLDNRNEPLAAPNAFQINASIQRCLAKAIALHGLGLHLYAGEDLPTQPPLDDEQTKELLTLLKDNNKEDLTDTVKHQIGLGQINQGNFQKAMEHYTNS